jgi:hypothetical protein
MFFVLIGAIYQPALLSQMQEFAPPVTAVY